MKALGNRRLGVLALLAFAIAFIGVAVSLSNADESKAPDLSDLRDAVAAASKRGDNVEGIRRAVDALQQSLAKGFTAPGPGKTVDPPPELVALRDAVEAAAKKGENVGEIRKQLEIVEKAITGKVLAKPKPPEPVEPNPFLPGPGPGPLPIRPRPIPNPQPMPAFPGFGVDQEAIQKAQDLMRKATEMILKNPDDPEAQRLMQQANDMLLKAMLGGNRAVPPLVIPGGPGIGRVPEKFRLGVRLERVSELAADQLGLEVARGVGIVGVVDGSAADKAGFKTFDIVLEFAGKPVSDNPEDFTRLVGEVKGGEKLNALVIRKGKKVEIKGIVLPEVPQPPQPRFAPVDGPNPFDGLENPRPGKRMEQDPNANTTFFSEQNGQVIIKATQNGVQYNITGQRKDDNSIDANKIAITDGDAKINAESLEKVPDKYRPVVERLLKSGQRRNIRER
jgi:serine protease Do